MLLPYAAASDIGSGACGAFFQKALAFEKKNSKGMRFNIECFGNDVYDHLAGSGYSHYSVCYQCLTPNGVVQNPLDFSTFRCICILSLLPLPLVPVCCNTNASRCCFHTLVPRTLGSGAFGAFFQKALAANNCSCLKIF